MLKKSLFNFLIYFTLTLIFIYIKLIKKRKHFCIYKGCITGNIYDETIYSFVEDIEKDKTNLDKYLDMIERKNKNVYDICNINNNFFNVNIDIITVFDNDESLIDLYKKNIEKLKRLKIKFTYHLVDNNSDDNTYSYLKNIISNNIIIYHNDKRNIADSLNIALKSIDNSTSNYVLFMKPFIFIYDEYIIYKMVDNINENIKYVSVYGYNINYSEIVNFEDFKGEIIINKNNDSKVLNNNFSLIESNFVNGILFDNNYNPFLLEDIDFSIRVNKITNSKIIENKGVISIKKIKKNKLFKQLIQKNSHYFFYKFNIIKNDIFKIDYIDNEGYQQYKKNIDKIDLIGLNEFENEMTKYIDKGKDKNNILLLDNEIISESVNKFDNYNIYLLSKVNNIFLFKKNEIVIMENCSLEHIIFVNYIFNFRYVGYHYDLDKIEDFEGGMENKEKLRVIYNYFLNKQIKPLSRNKICFYGPFCDQGLGIQIREYITFLKRKKYETVVYSHASKQKTNPKEWENIIEYNSNFSRGKASLEEILFVMLKYNIDIVIIPEICFSPLFKFIQYLKLLKIKVVAVVNIETIQYKEKGYMDFIDKIVANNYYSYLILKNVFKGKVDLLEFNNYYMEKNNNYNNIDKGIVFSCFGGFNSFFRKNIDTIYEIFYQLEKEKYNFQLNIYIQDESHRKLDINDTEKIKILYRNNDYNTNIKHMKKSDIIIHLGDHEGLGLGFFESLNNNKLTITLNTFPNNEYIINSINGFLVDCDWEKLSDNNYGIIKRAIVCKKSLYKIVSFVLQNKKIISKMNSNNKNIVNNYENNFIKILNELNG
jgi:hypothetical protein